jgi:hypothetical protein
MRSTLFTFIWFAALAALPATVSAHDTCCDHSAKACCEQAAAACCEDGNCGMPCCQGDAECDMPCCADAGTGPSAIDILISMDRSPLLPEPPSAIEILMAMDQNPTRPDSLAAHQAPVVQKAVVWFHRPVWVGNTVLMGKHVIEHDTDRMARGEPCTHIYAAGDLTKPVAAFHCTHLKADGTGEGRVVLRTLGDGQLKFLEFQFEGEDAAHGYPAGR